MARPLRLDAPGLTHHITQRGNERKKSVVVIRFRSQVGEATDPREHMSMRPAAPADLSCHRPLRIGRGPSTTGPRLDGNAPALPPGTPPLPDRAEYLLTFPLGWEPDLVASVYLNCSFELLLESRNRGFMSDDRIVVLTHDDAPRSHDQRHRSTLSSHPIAILDQTPDLISDEEGGFVISSDHKIGGRPYCIQEPELPGAEELFGKGYVQVLQLDFPSSEDATVRGSWPFGDGLFNLFWKQPFGTTAPLWYFQG